MLFRVIHVTPWCWQRSGLAASGNAIYSRARHDVHNKLITKLAALICQRFASVSNRDCERASDNVREINVAGMCTHRWERRALQPSLTQSAMPAHGGTIEHKESP